MKAKIPFTDYDFYAYLASGFALLFCCHFALDGLTIRTYHALELQFESYAAIFQGLILGIMAYVCGQMIASASDTLFERVLIGRLLIHPRDLLMGENAGWIGSTATCWGGRNYVPLERRLQAIIRTKIDHVYGNIEPRHDSVSKSDRKEARRIEYELVYSNARCSADCAQRMDASRNQYAFARNMALVGVINVVIAFFTYHLTHKEQYQWSLITSLVVAAGMLFRFFKFYGIFYSQAYRGFLADTVSSPVLADTVSSRAPACAGEIEIGTEE